MLYGIDISSHQKYLTVTQAHPRDFVIIKVTGGTWYENDTLNGVVDGTWRRQVAEARAAGFAIGFYHYAFEGVVPSNPLLEANFFLSKVRNVIQPGDIVCLDFEEPDAHGNLSAWALIWLQEVEAALGFLPFFYSYPNYLETRFLNAPELARYPLWLARYYTPYADYPWPQVPAPWQRIAIWQYGGGSPSDVWDRNIFDGTLEQFLDLGKPRVVAPQKPPVLPAEEEEVTVTSSINAKGETIVTLNFHGVAEEILGVNLQDVGVSVRNGTALYDRSVFQNKSQKWNKR